MIQADQSFRLTVKSGTGVSCDETGLFVGEAALLEKAGPSNGSGQWRPRPLCELNHDLGECYGLPIECNSKIDGLAAVGRALDRGDLAHAQIVALHPRLPDPPALKKSAQSTADIIDLARRLHAGGLLKADWDPAKHPRWPAKSPDSVGGEFAPGGGATGETASAAPSAMLIPAQFAVLLPFEVTIPETVPFPSEIGAPPLIGPSINPRELPRNPYPSRPECVEEWARAQEFCRELQQKGLLGKGGYRGLGNTFYQCLMGQISEGCGGNSLRA